MPIHIDQQGLDVLRDPYLNKSTAFTPEERKKLGLYGLLPHNIETIEEQLDRSYGAFSHKTTVLEKHIYLRALQDRNEVLFYRFLMEHLEEMMPIIYTPVVGEACQNFHRIYRQARGLFLSYPERDHMDSILATLAASRDISVIVVTDGERILGLGDQGAGGLGIPIGKLSLYTVCGGIHPAQTLPIILDVGTNNEERLIDPEYLGWRHHRINGKTYDDFVDQFVQSIKRHFPNVLLQFEDFAQQHAYPLLERYQDQLCTFNDDIQGTAAVTLAAVLAAAHVAGQPLKEHRIAVFGAGSAGCGISEQIARAMMHQGLSEAEAYSRFYLVDRQGLLDDSMTNLLDFQRPFAQKKSALQAWSIASTQFIGLDDVVRNAKPTILLGVSGQAQQFTESMVRHMASYCEHPIIFPLSNPTCRAEAIPADILHWTEGKALVATGSPFDPVRIGEHVIEIAQSNNSYIFPGVGLGIIAGKSRRVTHGMMMAAAIALSELAPALSMGHGALLPHLSSIRKVSEHIAIAVITQGIKEGHVKKMSKTDIEHAVKTTMWIPKYETFA
jgi:malate dehydrogenase (oxaloacetate-decarboxylating)